MQPNITNSVGWPLGKISDFISKLDSGVSVNGMDRPRVGDEPAVLKISAVTYGVFNPSACKPIISQDLNRSKCSPKRGDILISRSNTPELVGASAYIADDYHGLYLPDKLWRVVFQKDSVVSPLWFFYWLSSPRIRAKISSLATGTSSTMYNITKEEFLSLTLYVPPKEEQKIIAKILQNLDKIIEKSHAILLAKREHKRALMQRLLDIRFNTCEQWQEYRLGHLFNERVDTRHPDLPLLSITREKGVIPRGEVERKDTSNDDKSKYLRICVGDIGYNTMRMWQGVSALSTLEGIVSPAYTILTPKDTIDGRFAAYLFKYTPLVHLFQRYSQGLTSDTWNLKYRHFAEIKVHIPLIQKQRKIASVLSASDREIDQLTQKLNAYKQQKKELMHQLLTGKKRVKLDHKEAA